MGVVVSPVYLVTFFTFKGYPRMLCLQMVFPRDVLDEILNLIESVSEGFPSYSCVALLDLKDSLPWQMPQPYLMI